MIVAVHQPNYLPWLGYFRKIALADVFVFLDDAQFPKNSYTNRAQILAGQQARWLTVPVTAHLGDSIRDTFPARADWRRAHLDTLKNSYARAPAFNDTWADLQAHYAELPEGSIAATNRHLVEGLCAALGLRCTFVAASETQTDSLSGDDRLVAIVRRIAPGGTYLSGRGGAKYQDPQKFTDAGITLQYSDFDHPIYPQIADGFIPGLSVIDAVLSLGWSATSALIAGDRA